MPPNARAARAARAAGAAAPSGVPARERRMVVADCDSFFCAAAALADPDGAGRATYLIVGGGGPRGVVTSASYPCRPLGVRAGMPTAHARRLCPQALVVPVPGAMIERKSREVRAVVGRFTPLVEPLSIDEVLADFTGTEGLYPGEAFIDTLRRMRRTILEETGISVSIAASTSLTLSKICVEFAKHPPPGQERGVFVVPAGGELDVLANVALAEIAGVGPKFAAQLAQYGFRRCPDVWQADPATLAMLFGVERAAWLQDRSRGIDPHEVDPSGGPTKSVGREETFDVDVRDDAELLTELVRLVTRVASDLRAEGLQARTVTTHVKDYDFTARQKSRTLPAPVETDKGILTVARELLAELRRARRVPVRLLGVRLSNFGTDAAPEQLALFDVPSATPPVETDKDRRLAHAVDELRAKFGKAAILPATLAKPRGT